MSKLDSVDLTPTTAAGDGVVRPWGCITFSKSAKSTVPEADYIGSIIRYAEFHGGGAQPEIKTPPSDQRRPTLASDYGVLTINGVHCVPWCHAIGSRAIASDPLASRSELAKISCASPADPQPPAPIRPSTKKLPQPIHTLLNRLHHADQQLPSIHRAPAADAP